MITRSRMHDEDSSNRSKKTKVHAQDLLVRYGSTIALDSFSARIPEGITGLLGPNGAGKTTFIKTLLGQIQPENGKIVFEDKEIELKSVKTNQNIGYMPESECLIDDMKGFELVSYMGRLSGLTEDDSLQRAHKILDFVSLGEERYRKISSYSTGMKQRVKLAQAIVHDPDLILLDEPTNGMDPDGKNEMLELIEEIASSNKTVLISSHILHEVEEVGENVVIINDGKKVRSGPIDDLMGSEDGRYKIETRASEDKLKRFKNELEKNFDIVKTRGKKDKLTAVVRDVDKTEKIFKIAEKSNIQIRYLRPDFMTLEDFFLESFSGGDESGT